MFPSYKVGVQSNYKLYKWQCGCKYDLNDSKDVWQAETRRIVNLKELLRTESNLF
jgi:hypothetical protein